MHADDPAVEALCFEMSGGEQAMHYCFSCADEGDICAVAEHRGFAGGKTGTVRVERIHRRFSKTDVGRMVQACGGSDNFTGLEIVGGDENADVVNCTQGGQVVK